MFPPSLSIPILLGAFLCFYTGIGQASSIVIKTETSYDASRGEVRWIVSNEGDSLADEVVIRAVLPDGTEVNTEKMFLDGNDQLSGKLAAVIETPKPGTYVLPLIIDYREGTGQTHSTLAWVRHFSGGKPDKREAVINAKLEPPPSAYAPRAGFKGAGQLFLVAMSFCSEPIEAKWRVLLPKGIERVGEVPASLSIPADGVGYLEIGITNASAKAGEVPAAVLLEFDTADGRHHTLDVMTSIRVQSAEQASPSSAPTLFPKEITYLLLLIWVIVWTNRFVRRSMNGSAEETKPVLIWLDVAIVAGLTLYLGILLNVRLVFLDALCVGGDTPAHHYLMSHISETGKIVSWAPGWWSGFPMFRYYFPLPYVAMSALSHILSHNVAFKLGSIAGLLILPLSLYGSGRILRLPRPAPAILACLALPLVFDNTHSMWGINAYSTLAGMIANSWSFALMLPAVASACRDAQDGRFRSGTVLLLSAMVLSHFFTSMLAAAVLGVLFLTAVVADGVRAQRAASSSENGKKDCSPTPLSQRAWFVLLGEGLCVFLLTSWWVLPLVEQRAWSVDFGGKWDIRFFRQLPPMLPWSLVVALVFASLTAVRSRALRYAGDVTPMRLGFAVHSVLLAVSLTLFYGGGLLSDVFVNCRFWPFIVYALLTLSALLFSYASRVAGLPLLGTLLALAACLSLAWRVGGKAENPSWSKANHVPYWTAYNFKGVEALREGHVVQEIAESLQGTGGRMSQDLHPGNEWLGSSRIFETMPYLADKPMLEGGIVNSALGSLAAYALQGEVSVNPAGWPLIVKPRKFDPASGLRHLEFMDVRQFVARSHQTQNAFAADKGWRLTKEFGGGKWKLFESTLASSSPVRVWNEPLEAYRSNDPQHDLLEWMYVPGAVVEPKILLLENQLSPEGLVAKSPNDYRSKLAKLSQLPAPTPGWLDTYSTPCDEVKMAVDGSLVFHTEAIGKPHIVAMSYFPDWKVEGADRVYFLTPGYLAVYPTNNDVRLYHGVGLFEWIARGLTILGLTWVLGAFSYRKIFSRSIGQATHKG